MHLIQILLPIYDNEGMAIPREIFHAIGNELVQRFGGLTAHTRAPAEAGHMGPVRPRCQARRHRGVRSHDPHTRRTLVVAISQSVGKAAVPGIHRDTQLPDTIAVKPARKSNAATLDRSFFARDSVTVARDLIGVTLLVKGVGGVIVETEAYDPTEPASHSYNGRRTHCNSIDVSAARGMLYVYPVLWRALVPELRLRQEADGKRRADPGA